MLDSPGLAVIAIESQSKAKSVAALAKYQEAKAALAKANSSDDKLSPGSSKMGAPPPKVDLYK